MSITIYTDGAAEPTNPGKGGWACILVHDQGVKCCSGHVKHATNNQMELAAIETALSQIKPDYTGEISIFTDSQWSIGMLYSACQSTGNTGIHPNSQWTPTRPWIPKKNIEQINRIRELITKLKERTIIKMGWIRGHSGHNYNEWADRLATAACEFTHERPIIYYVPGEITGEIK